MDDQQGKSGGTGAVVADTAPESRDWGRQIIGALIGGALVLVIGTIGQRLNLIVGSLTRPILWGAVVGALFGSSRRLEHAGRRLTRRDLPWLNVLVALAGMAVIFVLFYVLTRGILTLVQRFM